MAREQFSTSEYKGNNQGKLPKEKKRVVDLEPVLLALGGRGRYQVLQLTMHLYALFVLPVPTLAVVFIGYQPDYQCGHVDNDTQLRTYLSEEDPTITDIVYNHCSIDVTFNASGNTSKSLSCVAGLNFSMPSDTSIVTEWSLVCDKAGLTELSQTVVFAGQGLGAALFSSLSDRFGRRKVYILCALGLAVGMACFSVVHNYYLFLFFRAVTGFFQTGMMNSAVTLAIELLPQRWRVVPSTLGSILWSLSCVFMAAVGYSMQGVSWRYLNLAFSAVFVHNLILPWVLDESLRWLAVTGNIQEAERILRKACRMNGKDFESVHKVFHNNIAVQGSSRRELGQTEVEAVVNWKDERVNRRSPAINERYTPMSELCIKGNTKSSTERMAEEEVSEEQTRKTDDADADLIEDTGDKPEPGNLTKHATEKPDKVAPTGARADKKEATNPKHEMLDGRNEDVCDEESENVEASVSANHTWLDLFKHRVVLLPLITVTSVWLTNDFYYYAVMLGSAELSGNRFLNFGLLSFLEIPSTIVAFFLIPRFNRKTLAYFYGFNTALFLFISTLLATLGHGVYLTLATVAQYVSKFTVIGSFCVLFVYFMEVFPTTLRSSAAGAAAAVVYITSMGTPFFVTWAKVTPWAPAVLISSLCFLATCFVSFLPETRHVKLPDTIEEIEEWRPGKAESVDSKKCESLVSP